MAVNPPYTTVETQLSTVLMAIRYGQGRATCAADNAEMKRLGWVLAVAEPDLGVCPGCDQEID